MAFGARLALSLKVKQYLGWRKKKKKGERASEPKIAPKARLSEGAKRPSPILRRAKRANEAVIILYTAPFSPLIVLFEI